MMDPVVPVASRALAVVCLAAIGMGCSTSHVVDRPLPDSPQLPVTLVVDWQHDLVDNGFFPFRERELGKVALSPDQRTAYIGTSDGVLFAIGAETGEILWRHEIGEPLDGAPIVSRGQLFIGGSDGDLYVLDAAGGGEMWRYTAGGSLDSTPALSADEVVFVSGIGTVICLDRETGAQRWRAADEDPVLRVTRGLHPPVKGQASPLLRDDRVIVGFPSGRISTINLATGSAVWTADLANGEVRHIDVDEPPVWADGRLFAASFSGGLYALDPVDGAIIWRSELRGATRPVVWEDVLLTTTADGRIVSVSQADGEVRWRLQLEQLGLGRAHLVGNYLVIPTTQDGLYVVDAGTPFIHHHFRPGTGFASVVAGPEGRIIALDNLGLVHGLRLIMR